MLPERRIEEKLFTAVAAQGGIAIKITAETMSGLPDRLCLFPGARICFAETKAPGKRPRPLQLVVHAILRSLGFAVYVIDSEDDISTMLLEMSLRD